MSTATAIEWTQATWNCLAGCEAISPGCAHCYAATMTRRLEAMGQADYTGLTTDKHFNGTVRCLPHKLDIPLKRKKPTTYFVNSMSDLFHEDVPDEFIDSVFSVMALCQEHTFQVLTKRAERMYRYTKPFAKGFGDGGPAVALSKLLAGEHEDAARKRLRDGKYFDKVTRPLSNVWLGVSAEDQQRADERLPWLLKTPAAVRFVSAEPLLGPIDFEPWLKCQRCGGIDGDNCRLGLDWVIVGGESGGCARACRPEWIRLIVSQCETVSVPCFVKQFGGNVVTRNDMVEDAFNSLDTGWPEPEVEHHINGFREDYQGADCRIRLRDKKGGDPSEWPEDLRVREFPTPSEARS